MRRGDAYLTMVEIVERLDDPYIIHNYELISRDTLKYELDLLKPSIVVEVDIVANFTAQ